jgi:DNA-binding MarR family transcriptional regulator
VRVPSASQPAAAAERHEDLAALFARITRRLLAAERPLLARHGVSMWEYVVLSELARAPAPTQAALAGTVGYDRSRLIALLDELEDRGLITRTQAPDDRRAHAVGVTARGRRLHERVQADIRSMERRLLADLERSEQEALLETLQALAAREGRGE